MNQIKIFCIILLLIIIYIICIKSLINYENFDPGLYVLNDPNTVVTYYNSDSLNKIKGQYDLSKLIIGYYNSLLENQYDDILDNIMKDLLSSSDILYLSKKPYNNIYNLFIDLGTPKSNIKFALVDSISSSKVYTDIYNGKIDIDPKLEFSLDNINFVVQINFVLLFTIINTSNVNVQTEEQISKIGLIDNYMFRNISNDIKQNFILKYNKQISFSYYKNYDKMYDDLDKQKIDCILFVDRLTSDYLSNLFFKYQNFMIFEFNMNYSSETTSSALSFYTPLNLDLNIIKGYLPRKFANVYYNKFNPNIQIFGIPILLFCSSDIDPMTTASITKVYSAKFQSKTIQSIGVNSNTTPVEYIVDTSQLYKGLSINQAYFNRYFKNSPGTDKFLEKVGIIEYKKSPNCIDIWGGCTEDNLAVLFRSMSN